MQTTTFIIDTGFTLCYKYKVAARHIWIGDWSNGMIGVSKTFGGSSILSSPANKSPETSVNAELQGFFVFWKKG